MNMKDKTLQAVNQTYRFDKRLAVLQEEIVAPKEISGVHVEIIEVYGDKLDFMQRVCK